MNSSILYYNDTETGSVDYDFVVIHKLYTEGDRVPLFKLNTENISYNINDGGVELRGNLAIECTEILNKECAFIIDTELSDTKKENELIIFFANANETVWDVSKRYKVNPKDVIDLNLMENSDIKKGQKIIIPSY